MTIITQIACGLLGGITYALQVHPGVCTAMTGCAGIIVSKSLLLGSNFMEQAHPSLRILQAVRITRPTNSILAKRHGVRQVAFHIEAANLQWEQVVGNGVDRLRCSVDLEGVNLGACCCG